MNLLKNSSKLVGLALSLFLLLGAVSPNIAAQNANMSNVFSKFKTLKNPIKWNYVKKITIDFKRTYDFNGNTYNLSEEIFHPQGMYIIGDHIYVSNVEITQETKKCGSSHCTLDGYDRTPGAGVGHLFKLTLDGTLVGAVDLVDENEKSVYHPGGIDYDGKYIWTSVAQYRPHSRSIVYKIDPETMKAEQAFKYNDHIGSILHNTDMNTLHAVSWGSRVLYVWEMEGERITNVNNPYSELNQNFFIDYQDCKYLKGTNHQICGGLNQYKVLAKQSKVGDYNLGGINLIKINYKKGDDQKGKVHNLAHLITVPLYVNQDVVQADYEDYPTRVMTFNPFFIEQKGSDRLRFYFMPEDFIPGKIPGIIYVYDVETS